MNFIVLIVTFLLLGEEDEFSQSWNKTFNLRKNAMEYAVLKKIFCMQWLKSLKRKPP